MLKPPPGALPEEVADDIDAKLSEGEFVLPADVVRWHGLKRLMEMRAEAKTGLMAMEQEGQIGGEPVDEPMLSGGMMGEPEDTPGFAQGGLVGGPRIESYTDQFGRLAYRYLDAEGKPIGQPMVVAPNQGAWNVGSEPSAPSTGFLGMPAPNTLVTAPEVHGGGGG